MISTVPSAGNAARAGPACGGVRTRLGTRIPPSRTRTRSSPDASTDGSTRGSPSGSSVSTSTIRSGFSVCADRTRPCTAAAAGSGSARVPAPSARSSPVSAPSPAGTPSRVTTTRRPPVVSVPASQVCNSSSSAEVTAWILAGGSPSAVGQCSTVTSAGTPCASGTAGSAGTASGPAGCQVSSNSAASPPARAPWAALSGRSARESADRIPRPVPSATSTATEPSASSVSRTRRPVASAAASRSSHRTPCQENGSAGSVSGSSAGCSAASSSAARTGSAEATSANSSSPRRHSARRPRKPGPYSRPCAARSSYQVPRSAGSASAGGQSAMSGQTVSAGPVGAESAPAACSRQSVRASRAYSRSGLRPLPSPGSTWSCSSISPCSGTSTGASSVSSSTASPSVPACSAMSSSAVPGTTTRPRTRWPASHGWLLSESRPVCTVPSPSARSRGASSSGRGVSSQ